MASGLNVIFCLSINAIEYRKKLYKLFILSFGLLHKNTNCLVMFTKFYISLVLQLYTVDLNNPDDCASKFRSNTQLGFVMFMGIVLGTLLKKEGKSSDKSVEQDKTISY